MLSILDGITDTKLVIDIMKLFPFLSKYWKHDWWYFVSFKKNNNILEWFPRFSNKIPWIKSKWTETVFKLVKFFSELLEISEFF